MDRIKWSIGFTTGVALDREARSGELALWWRDHVQVMVRAWSQYFIDAEVRIEGKTCRVTGLYGEPVSDLHQKSWDDLQYLQAQDDLPWIFVGDFNDAMFQTDQSGGNLRSFMQMEDSRDCLTDCGLADLGFSGYPYRWDNKRDGAENV